MARGRGRDGDRLDGRGVHAGCGAPPGGVGRAKAGEVVADEASLLAARSATAAAASASRLANWVGLGAIGLASAVGLLLLHAGIARPIAGMTAMMGRLAQGDVGLTVPGAGRRDEVGAMAAAVGVFTLGTIPLSNTIAKGNLVVFAGRRWLVEDINEQAQVLQVSAHQGGVIPKFDRLSVEPAYDRLVAEMRLVYVAGDIPPYLDTQAAAFLAEGRAAHRRLGLGTTTVLDTAATCIFFFGEEILPAAYSLLRSPWWDYPPSDMTSASPSKGRTARWFAKVVKELLPLGQPISKDSASRSPASNLANSTFTCHSRFFAGSGPGGTRSSYPILL